MTPIQLDTRKETALHLDCEDPLKAWRSQFYIPINAQKKPIIYFCGNSLGLQPRNTRAYIEQELLDWEKLGVEGHFHARNPWMPYHELLTNPMANIVGAKTSEVVIMNALTVNLHLLMASFYRPTPERFKIIIEKDAFPSDRYAVTSQIQFHGYLPQKALIELESSGDKPSLKTEEILHTIEKEGDEVALILLGGVNYYTGQAFEMDKITTKGQQKGCTVGFDLAHAAGNIPLSLHRWGVDFAAWCSYKYLNAGPGGVAGCFIHEKHHSNPGLPRFAGWWGHNKTNRFKMPANFDPIPTAEGWQLSNAPVLSMAALRASLAIFESVGMEALRKKSVLLTNYLEFLLNAHSEELNITIITPTGSGQRGCQLSLKAKTDGKKLYDHLSSHGVICDWREPDVIRVAPVPLYNTFTEVWDFVQIIRGFYQK